MLRVLSFFFYILERKSLIKFFKLKMEGYEKKMAWK